MFHHYDDHGFKKIIDEFILSSTNDDKELSYIIKNIDYQASKAGISFYHMMFILIQKDLMENKRKQRKKKWLGNKITTQTFSWID